MKPLPFGSRTYIMGILNVTPDSFSGDGLMDCARTVSSCARPGAAIPGGRRGYPGYRRGKHPPRRPHRSARQEELSRVLPVIWKALAAPDLDVILSVDTYKSEVAEAALELPRRLDQRRVGIAGRPAPGRVRCPRTGAADPDAQPQQACQRGAAGTPGRALRRVGIQGPAGRRHDASCWRAWSWHTRPGSRTNPSSSIPASALARPSSRTWS